MSGIDDWYLDYAHRHELTPGFSPDDDIPDPYVHGESPGREWAVPSSHKPRQSGKKKAESANGIRNLPPAKRGGSWEAAARKWLAAFPQGTNRECQRALALAGHTNTSTQLIGRLRATMPKPAQAQIPKKKTKQVKSGSADNTDVSTLRAQTTPVRRTPGRRSSAAEPVRRPAQAPAVSYCDGCGMAVSHDGRCRC